MKNIIGITLLFLGISHLSAAADLITETSPNPSTRTEKSTLYEIGSNHQKVLFKVEQNFTTEGTKTLMRSRFLNPDGTEALLEESVLNGDRLQTYKIEQLQLGKKLLAEVKNGKIIFNVTEGNKTETDSESYNPDVIVGSQLAHTVVEQWDTLMKGEDFSLRLAVLDRKETVGFKLVKAGKQPSPSTLVLEFKPTSFIIAALVKPLIFTYDVHTKKIVSLIGRTLPKIKKEEKWADCDAEWVFGQ